MKIVTTRKDVRQALGQARSAARSIVLVPTMGYLHEGHLSLCDRAHQLAEYVVLSSFVNPLQFGPGEDLERYPRDPDRDAELAWSRGVDLLFQPGTPEMYPMGEPRVGVTAPTLTDRLCGRFRPGHFDGVLTVVAKLFHLIAPDVAVFGQKDLQQAVLIRRMVQDLDFPLRVEVAPIIREADGLAMSSRNVYLTAAERTRATALPGALRAAQDAFTAGERSAPRLLAAGQAVLEKAGIAAQYLELIDVETLEAVARAGPGNAVAVAAYVGTTRLIDNHILI